MTPSEYEYEEEEIKPKMLTVSRWLSWASWGLAAITVVIMFLFMDSRTNQFGLHLIDAIRLALYGIFFFFFYIHTYYDNPNVMELRIISLFAGIATLVKLIITAFEVIPQFSSNIVIDLYCFGQLAVWALLTAFFFLYWWKIHDYEFESDIED